MVRNMVLMTKSERRTVKNTERKIERERERERERNISDF